VTDLAASGQFFVAASGHIPMAVDTVRSGAAQALELFPECGCNLGGGPGHRPQRITAAASASAASSA